MLTIPHPLLLMRPKIPHPPLLPLLATRRQRRHRRQRVEKELIAEFNEVGIDLCFNLIRDVERTFVPSFMCC